MVGNIGTTHAVMKHHLSFLVPASPVCPFSIGGGSVAWLLQAACPKCRQNHANDSKTAPGLFPSARVCIVTNVKCFFLLAPYCHPARTYEQSASNRDTH